MKAAGRTGRPGAITRGLPTGRPLGANAARAEVGCRAPELLLDPQQLVVLGDAVRASGRARLDLAAVGRHREIGDGRVLGLAGAVGDDRGGSRRARPSQAVSSVSVRVPIWLTFTRMALATPPAMPRSSRSTFVTKMSSPTSWTRPPSALVCATQPSQSSSAIAVLERDDRVAIDEVRPSRRSSSSEERVRPSPASTIAAVLATAR